MISFIVPAYNEEQCLAETLDALHAAGMALGEAYEVILADDGSTDQTAAIGAQKGSDAGSDPNLFQSKGWLILRVISTRKC